MDNGFVVLPRLAPLIQVDGAHTPGLAILGYLAIHPLKYTSYGTVVAFDPSHERSRSTGEDLFPSKAAQ